MAGKPKDKLTALPKLDEWKAPWEVDKDGVDIPTEDQKIDPAQLKRYLHGLLGDKITIRNSLDETTARAEELEQKLVDATDPKALEKAQEELAAARKERDEAQEKAKDDSEVLKYRIALRKGLTETQAKRLLGTTEEELEQDAEELLASFGASGEDEGGGDTIRRAPKRKLGNAGDPDPDAPPTNAKEQSPEEVAAAWLANR